MRLYSMNSLFQMNHETLLMNYYESLTHPFRWVTPVSENHGQRQVKRSR